MPIDTPGLINKSSVALLSSLYGENAVAILYNPIIQMIGGDHIITSNNFGGVKIDTQSSAFAVGSNNTVVNTNKTQALDDSTKQLLDEINKSEISPQEKEDLKDAVQSVTEQVKSKKPNKITLAGIMSGINSIVETVKNSQTLVDTFEKWKVFAESFIK
ncbi:MAG: hypothetical protein A4E53_03528 [Pelotomaculum sp. PtaB.Bin104]|nr:MAG: hypothetical protein A4E53_03528 [Pelotomaculum sp. PtaB.Bin104]